MSSEQEIQKALEFQDELPPIPRPAPVLKAPPIRQELLSFDSRLARLEQMISRLADQRAQPAASSSPLAEMAATWQMFNQIQMQAQDSVQKNYLFTRQLAEDIAAGKSTAGETSEIGAIMQGLQALPQILPLLQQQQAPSPSPAPPSPAPVPGPTEQKTPKAEVVK